MHVNYSFAVCIIQTCFISWNCQLGIIPLNQDVSYTRCSDPLWLCKVWSYAVSWKKMLLLLLWQYLKLFHLHHSQKLFACTSCWKLSYKYYCVTSNIYCCPPKCGSNACKKKSLKNFYFLECIERFIKLFITCVIEWKLHCSNVWNNILVHF